MAKSGRPQIQIFTKIFEVKTVSCVLKDNNLLDNQSFESITDVSKLFVVRSNSY